MKRRLNKSVGFALISCLFWGSCSTSGNVYFSERGKWTVDKTHNCITNGDGDFVFPLKGINDSTLLVISDNTDLQGHPRVDKYLSHILRKTGLSGSKILLYLPERNSLWMEMPENYQHERPKSITVNMQEECPYTMWVHPDENERWERKATEMYTYTYYDKCWKWLCIVDIFNYGTTPIARLTILQTKTRRFKSLGLPDDCTYVFSTVSLHSIEMLSHWVDGHRGVSIDNYRKGVSHNNR